MSCDLAVDVRITTSDGASSFSLEDHGAGYTIMNEIGEPEWDESAPVVSGVYMHGDAPTAPPTLVVGFLPVVVEVSGTPWAQTVTRRDALEAAWRAEDQFLLDVEVEGVTQRYRASRSAWRSEPRTPRVVKSGRQEVTLVFRVQPFPLTLTEES